MTMHHPATPAGRPISIDRHDDPQPQGPVTDTHHHDVGQA